MERGSNTDNLWILVSGKLVQRSCNQNLSGLKYLPYLVKGEERRDSEEEREEKRVSGREEKGQILFLEVDGDLVGIDLNERQGNPSQKPPPFAPVCCRLELRKKKFPLAMRHLKLDNKNYLVGGIKFDRGVGFYHDYSEFVYEIDPEPITNGGENVIVPVKRVLKCVNNLCQPKFVIVANLRGTIYVLQFWMRNVMHCPITGDIRCVFEFYDPVNKSWCPAPTPPFYKNIYFNADNPKDSFCPEDLFMVPSPVFLHFVVDDKLFIHGRGTLHCFNRASSQWVDLSSLYFKAFRSSFEHFYTFSPWFPLFWLSGGCDIPLGVTLSIKREPGPCKHEHCHDSMWDEHFSLVYKAFALIVNENGVVEHYQDLKEALLVHLDCNSCCDVGYFLDLGKGAQENCRRICAVLIDENGGGGRTCHLYISIFDVEMIPIQTIDSIPTTSDFCQPVQSKFLKVYPVKQVSYLLERDTNICPCSGNDLEFDVSELSFLNAFVL